MAFANLWPWTRSKVNEKEPHYQDILSNDEDNLEALTNVKWLQRRPSRTWSITKWVFKLLALAVFVFGVSVFSCHMWTHTMKDNSSSSIETLSAGGDDPIDLPSWAFSAYGANVNGTCDKGFYGATGQGVVECSPLGPYLKTKGVQFGGPFTWQVCLFSDPACDEVVASYTGSGLEICRDGKDAVTYKVTESDVECVSHSW